MTSGATAEAPAAAVRARAIEDVNAPLLNDDEVRKLEELWAPLQHESLEALVASINIELRGRMESGHIEKSPDALDKAIGDLLVNLMVEAVEKEAADTAQLQHEANVLQLGPNSVEPSAPLAPGPHDEVARDLNAVAGGALCVAAAELRMMVADILETNTWNSLDQVEEVHLKLKQMWLTVDEASKNVAATSSLSHHDRLELVRRERAAYAEAGALLDGEREYWQEKLWDEATVELLNKTCATIKLADIESAKQLGMNYGHLQDLVQQLENAVRAMDRQAGGSSRLVVARLGVTRQSTEAAINRAYLALERAEAHQPVQRRHANSCFEMTFKDSQANATMKEQRKDQKKIKKKETTQLHHMQTVAKVASPVTGPANWTSCILGCGNMAAHWLNRCKLWVEGNDAKRAGYVLEHNLCIKCLGQHAAKTCKMRLFQCKSKNCDQQHHQSLHGMWKEQNKLVQENIVKAKETAASSWMQSVECSKFLMQTPEPMVVMQPPLSATSFNLLSTTLPFQIEKLERLEVINDPEPEGLVRGQLPVPSMTPPTKDFTKIGWAPVKGELVLKNPLPTPKVNIPTSPAEEVLTSRRGSRRAPLGGHLTLMTLTVLSLLMHDAWAFKAYDCSKGPETIQAYSLLEPTPCKEDFTDYRFQKQLQVEIVQQKKLQTVPIRRCVVFESVFSQYCGYFSRAGVVDYIKFREPKVVEPSDCRQAFNNKGKFNIDGMVVQANLGGMSSIRQFLEGNLDDSGNCETGSLRINGKVLKNRVVQRVLEVSLLYENAHMDHTTNTIVFNNNVMAQATDSSLVDGELGTVLWKQNITECPENLVQLYRGDITMYTNDPSGKYEGSVTVLEKPQLVAGLEIKEVLLLCGYHAHKTHIKGILMIIHHANDVKSAMLTPKFDAGAVTEQARLENEIGFLHVRSELDHNEKLRKVKLEICNNRRDLLMTRLEAVAGVENPYSLLRVFGKGHIATRAGSVVYVAKCKAVDVVPTFFQNCTNEIPALLNETRMFVDPISLVLKEVPTILRCNKVATPKWFISESWFCRVNEDAPLEACPPPEMVPLQPVNINVSMPAWRLGASIYTDDELEQFYAFQQTLGLRTAYLSDQTNNAYEHRTSDGQWGLSLGEHARESLTHLMSLQFIPFYSVIGPLASMLTFAFLAFSLCDIVITVLFRMAALIWKRGCGHWILGAFCGVCFQICYAPVRAVNEFSNNVADKVEEGIPPPKGPPANVRVPANIGRIVAKTVGAPYKEDSVAIEMQPLSHA